MSLFKETLTEGADRTAEFPDDVDVTLAHAWVRDLIECPVCFDIPRPPIMTCVVGHIVCDSCRSQTHGTCPVCRSPYSQTRNFLAEAVVERQYPTVSCKYAEDGCQVVAKRAEMDAHEPLCEYRVVPCEYSSEGCKVSRKFRDLHIHLVACRYRPVVCNEDGCEAIVKFSELDAHLACCRYRRVPCEYSRDGCPAIVKFCDFNTHLIECEYQPVLCSLWEDGCKAIIKFCDLDVHLAECEYANRLVSCKSAKYGRTAYANLQIISPSVEPCYNSPIKCPWCPEKRLAIDYDSYPNHVLSECSTIPDQVRILDKESVDPKMITVLGACGKDFPKVSSSCPDVERLTTFTSFNQVFMIQMAYYRKDLDLSIALWVSLVAPKSITEYNSYKVFIRLWPCKETDEGGWDLGDLVPVNNFLDDAEGVVKKGAALVISLREMRKFPGAEWGLVVTVYKI